MVQTSVFAVLLAAFLITSPGASHGQQVASERDTASHLINGYEPKWWKEAVVYQIYPRSFQDSNGDGIGDLKGITQNLDYLQKLGVNVIWLSPHFASPNADNGYDISDYRAIMADFGTMADFDAMLAGIKQRHMRLIIDLVANHTSDEHQWFVESRSSKDNPYRDFYFWRPGKTGPDDKLEPPNNYRSVFSGSAWQFDPKTNEYYLHYFAVKQPDLTPEQLKNEFAVFAAGPHRDEYLQQMNREVLSKYNDMSVGEAAGITLAQEPDLVDDRRHELNEIFNFDAVRVNRRGRKVEPLVLTDLKAIYTNHEKVLGKHDWDTVFLSNHDNPRIVSTFGDDSPEFRVPSAKLFEAMILTLKGTPYLFQGDELGMTNYPFKSIADYNDIKAKNAWNDEVETRHTVSADQYLAELRGSSRDNARTPMQWTHGPNAGFTTASAKPWLAVNPNYTTINAAQETADPNSVYNYTRQLIALRAKTAAFVYGDFKDLDPNHPQIFLYTRSLNGDQYLVIHNFSSRPIEYTLPDNLKAGTLLLANYPSHENSSTILHLKGWESRIYKE
jgi:oligo-1,6-glucosidase